MGLGNAHGVERGHGTARERGERGAEGVGVGVTAGKKELPGGARPSAGGGRGRAGRGRGPDERDPVAGGWWARWLGLGRADWAGAAERARGDAGAGRVARWRAGERAGRESQLGHGGRSGVASWAGRVGLDLASLG